MKWSAVVITAVVVFFVCGFKVDVTDTRTGETKKYVNIPSITDSFWIK